MNNKKRYYQCIVRRNLVENFYGIRNSKNFQEKDYYEGRYEHQLKIFSEALKITSGKLDRKIKRYIKAKDFFKFNSFKREVKRFFNKFKHIFKTRRECKSFCLFCNHFDCCIEDSRRLL